jgi:endonuclease/exonuclease/phosphatase family metal-dependent hydrolase
MKKVLIVLNVLAVLALFASYAARWISPQSFPFMALFGLGYPVCLAANVFFLGLWLLAKPRMMLISGAALALGWSIHGDFFSFRGSRDTEGLHRLKIITYNVRLFDYYNWKGGKQTRNQIFDQLKKRQPDVVCFQEFYYTEKKGVFETRDTLKTILGLPHIHEHYTHHLTGKQYFGLATYSKFPIVKRGHIEFASDKNNFAIYTDIKKGKDTLRVFNMHLASIRFKKEDYEILEEDGNSLKYADGKRFISRLLTAFEKRAEQTEEVLAVIRQSPHPVLLGGDFNDTPVSYCYRQFDKELNDAFKQAGSGISNTYIGKFPSFRIDYIMHSDELKTVEYARLPEKLSDHHALEAVVVWGEPEVTE